MSLLMPLRRSLLDAVNRRFFYGWTMAGVASLGVFASGPGQSHTFSVFVEPISRDLGISSTEIATAYGMATLAAALLLPLTGRIFDRYGPRRSLTGIVLLLGLACLFFGAAANFLWLALGFGMLRFFGQGSLMLGSANLVSQWFSRKRGFAMSLMALGFAVSMAIHPPLSQYLVAEIGWRRAWLVLGLSTWLIMLAPVLLMVFDTPESVGLRPDGDHAPEAGDGVEPAAITGLTLHQALRTSSFHILAYGWFGLSMLTTALHFYQVKILTLRGVSSEAAALVFTMSALTMVVAMPLVGRLFDRVKTRYGLALGLVIMAGSLIAMSLASGLTGAVVYALIFGLNNAFNLTMFGYMWPRYFGRLHVGSIQGTGQMVAVVGASLGPLPVGLAFDLIGDPSWILRLLALYPISAACIVLAFLRTHPSIRDHAHLE